MHKENTLRQALGWLPPTTTLQAVGANRARSANDAPFLPPPPPSPQQRIKTFGGRQHRYQEQRQQQLRVYDPLAQEYVAFGHERYLLAWTLMRFCWSVSELNARPAPVAYMHAGRKVQSRPHLTWRIVGSGRKVFFWLRQEWTDDDRQRFMTFGRTHDVDVVLGTWAELEAHEQLLDNLQAGRQRMTMVAHAGLDVREIAGQILRHLRAHHGHATRGELGGELCSTGCLDCDAQLDAALFHLHAVGRVRLDVDHDVFDDDTMVHCA